MLFFSDELLFEVKESEMNEMISIIKKCMENVYELSVPLRVQIKVGKRWGSMLPIGLCGL